MTFESADTIPALLEDGITWPDTDQQFERRKTAEFSVERLQE